MRRRILAVLALATVAISLFIACRRVTPCMSAIVCTDAELRPGLCISDGRGPNRYCALPAEIVCPSKWRWDYTAPDDLYDLCVDPALIPKDAGADATPAPDAGADQGQ